MFEGFRAFPTVLQVVIESKRKMLPDSLDWSLTRANVKGRAAEAARLLTHLSTPKASAACRRLSDAPNRADGGVACPQINHEVVSPIAMRRAIANTLSRVYLPQSVSVTVDW